MAGGRARRRLDAAAAPAIAFLPRCGTAGAADAIVLRAVWARMLPMLAARYRTVLWTGITTLRPQAPRFLLDSPTGAGGVKHPSARGAASPMGSATRIHGRASQVRGRRHTRDSDSRLGPSWTTAPVWCGPTLGADPAFAHLAARAEDADLAFLLGQVDATILHGAMNPPAPRLPGRSPAPGPREPIPK